jgi:hypothetical protein
MVVRIAGARMYCGVPSTTKARFSTCWFSGGAILRGGLRQDEPVACPYLPLDRNNLICQSPKKTRSSVVQLRPLGQWPGYLTGIKPPYILVKLKKN